MRLDTFKNSHHGTGLVCASQPATDFNKSTWTNGNAVSAPFSMSDDESVTEDDDQPPNRKAVHFEKSQLSFHYTILKDQAFLSDTNGTVMENGDGEPIKSNGDAGSNGRNGIIRSMSLSAELDGANMFDSANIRERFGRTRRRPSTSKKKKFEKRELVTIIALGMVDFVGFCSMSVMAPFFPSEAAKKGMDVSHAGYVFSFYALVMFLTSPLFGKVIPNIGTKFVFMSGVFITGGCNILFGMLPMIQNNTHFAIFCFLVRGLEAVGAGAFSTASFIYVIHIFPDNISAVLGIMETFAGLGMSIGPALGGILYSIGGFPLPFYSLGLAMIGTLPIYYHLLPAMYGSKSTKQSGSLFSLFKIPSIFVIFFVVVITSNAWSFLDPTLEPHLRQLNLSSQQTGLVFLAFSAVYAICSPLWGYIGDKCNNHWSMMAIGLVIGAFALMLLGPSPLIPDAENTLWLNIVSLCILAVGVAMTFAPTFKALVECAKKNGYGDSLATYSVVAGVWSSAYSFGDMTGPAIGGILLEHFSFPICTTVMAILALSTAVVCVLYFGFIDDYPRKTEYSTLHPLLRKDKLAYYGALSNSSDAITITLTNGGACEV